VTLACLIGLCIFAEVFVLRQVGAFLDAIHQATASLTVARPADDLVK
jgi:hypothetical protein